MPKKSEVILIEAGHYHATRVVASTKKIEASKPAATTAPQPGLRPATAQSPLADDPAAVAEKARQAKIQALTQQFLSTHPGVSYKTARLSVLHENPQLMDEHTATLDTREVNMVKQEKLKAAIDKVRKQNPSYSFDMAWNKLRREQPSLFDWESK
jgi:hypothetical protein